MDIIIDVAAQAVVRSGAPFQKCRNRVWLQERNIEMVHVLGKQKPSDPVPSYPQITNFASDQGTFQEIVDVAPAPPDKFRGGDSETTTSS